VLSRLKTFLITSRPGTSMPKAFIELSMVHDSKKDFQNFYKMFSISSEIKTCVNTLLNNGSKIEIFKKLNL